jgi:hypothetical protein
MYQRLFWPVLDILETMMTDISQIQADVAALQDAEAAAADELATLASQVNAMREAGANNVSDEDLAQLHDNLQSVTSALTLATESAQQSAPHPDTEPVGDQPEINPE